MEAKYGENMLTSLFIGSYRLRTQRIVPAILLIASVSLSGCFSKTYLKEKDLRTFFRYSPQRKPVVSVHSSDGVYAGYPENCLESFAFVARQMQVLIEADFSLTRDSTLIVLGDDTY